MKKELTEKLMFKYHDMFHDLSRGEAKPLIRFIECGDGWYDIIERLCDDIHAMNPKVMQIKEKFGGLRFYCSFNSDYSDQGWKRIRKAEEEASETCEDCGKPGNMQIVSGWRGTVCEECHKKWLDRISQEDLK